MAEFLLLEDGSSKLLLEDGSSRLLLEADSSGVALSLDPEALVATLVAPTIARGVALPAAPLSVSQAPVSAAIAVGRNLSAGPLAVAATLIAPTITRGITLEATPVSVAIVPPTVARGTALPAPLLAASAVLVPPRLGAPETGPPEGAALFPRDFDSALPERSVHATLERRHFFSALEER